MGVRDGVLGVGAQESWPCPLPGQSRRADPGSKGAGVGVGYQLNSIQAQIQDRIDPGQHLPHLGTAGAHDEAGPIATIL